MDTQVAESILRGLQIYGAIGVAVALPFALFVAPRLDPGARGSSVAFRLLIAPGAALIWPIVVARSIALARRRG